MIKSKFGIILGLFMLMGISIASAAPLPLEVRLGGLAYYDPDLDITWYVDASSNGNNGNWIAQTNSIENTLNVGGVTGWRLPTAGANPAGCPGDGCLTNEMGYMFNERGTNSGSPDVFSNLQGDLYFSGTPSGGDVWMFNFLTGFQSLIDQNTPHQGANGVTAYTWAVHDGDVGGLIATPLPAAVWMFGAAFMGIVGLRRRKSA